MLQLTSEAADFIRTVRDEDGRHDHLLRIVRSSSGDRDRIRLAFVPAAQPSDQIGQSHGVALCVASDVSSSLDDMLLDVQDTTGGRGLVFRPLT